MVQVLYSVWALLLGVVLIMLGNGMHSTLIGLRLRCKAFRIPASIWVTHGTSRSAECSTRILGFVALKEPSSTTNVVRNPAISRLRNILLTAATCSQRPPDHSSPSHCHHGIEAYTAAIRATFIHML